MKEGNEKRHKNDYEQNKDTNTKIPSRLDLGSKKIYHKYSQNEVEIMKHPEYMDTVGGLYAKGLCTFPHRLC